MARPIKNNCDAFPFFCSEGRAAAFMEHKHRNNGLATWVKILRALTITSNHFIDMSKPAEVLFLHTKCHMTKEELFEIIDDLVVIGELDRVLWEQHGVIWSQKLVDSLGRFYSRRVKPCIKRDQVIAMVKAEPRPDLEMIQAPINKRAKKKPKSKEPDFIDGVVDLFCAKFNEIRGRQYDILSRGKERGAAGKIVQLSKSKFPGITADELLAKIGQFFVLCLQIENKFYRQNMNLTFMVAKFNEIKNYLHDEKSNKDRGHSETARAGTEQIDNIVDRAFGDTEEGK